MAPRGTRPLRTRMLLTLALCVAEQAVNLLLTVGRMCAVGVFCEVVLSHWYFDLHGS